MATKIALKLRLLCDDEIAMGPGKADLLEAIGQNGSISAAARTMNMSYRRAWMLVDVMNRNFREPLVHSSVGGSQGGGAQLTEAGARVLVNFRAMEAAATVAAEKHLLRLAKEMHLESDQ
ncbi:LysR family transcriptional regulator [Undibacterium sp. RTI2.1]|uniref:winged helix-turn-helix domain-containing protein n=1 Tax=unclassified Undibacterium TaxID=2630295 RepID=UPI002AB4D935|nr:MULTISPECIES: LysR family transcriptional regulator [unclassified Undibacterium]MDY7539891.1 LysR family transcriptional regulator [Undibacterium sp. 5I1]MEB0033114.1 LysR family transcriptional regulator [Undibacterium sp. RTI2.1]MEB0118918.1 LysR family transcriptional regulator [Undibacterium sp. RTI2.2]MEB0233166.1 LysR family transcriptional regulator [Undibacterium sp. 10I3]MEB0257196.1 LysR family transcriptional regulator [Undibacterium sp. 5I1]